MIRLALLGGIDLLDPANPHVSAFLSQRKRVALLVYLALAGPGAPRSRDAALALFWPEVDQRRARSSLRQALYSLRLSLGRDIVVTRGDGHVATSPAALWCDAVAFEQALKSGDEEEALRLYRGDLLPGFYVDDAPGFERWLDEERPRLRRKARDASWRLADGAEQRGELEEAARWARRSTELSHDDEASLQKLLHLLGRVGDRSGALHAYDEFAVRLAKDFDAAPSAETRRVIDAIRTGSGSRIEHDGAAHAPPPAPTAGQRDAVAWDQAATSPPDNVIALGATPAAETLPPATIARRIAYRQLARALFWPMAAALTLASLAGLGALLRHASIVERALYSPSNVRIAVSEFTDLSSAPQPDVLGSAITTAVVARLAEVRSFDVVPSSVPLRSRQDDAASARSPRFRVSGSVLRSGSRVHVDVEVIDAVSGSTVGTAATEHASPDSIALVDALSRDVTAAIRVAIGREMRGRARYLAASDGRSRRLLTDAAAERERARALERDGRISMAARALRRADSLLAGAQAISPTSNAPVIERAHVEWELAVLYLMADAGDAPRADTLLRRGIANAERAVAIDAHDAAALETLGLLSYWSWLRAPFASDSARATLSRALGTLRSAVALEPGRASAWSMLSAALYSQADYGGAYLAADRAYRADAYLDDTEEILNRLFMAAYEIGDDADARRWCEEIDQRFPRSWTAAYCRLSLLAWDAGGDPAAARHAWEIVAEGGRHPVLLRSARPRLYMLVAAVLARAGLRDSAEVIVRRSLADAGGDPEILPLEASVRISLGQPDVAVARLAQYVRGKPLHRAAVACSRRFAALRALGRKRGVFLSCAHYSELLGLRRGLYAGAAPRVGDAVDLPVDEDADILVVGERARASNTLDRAEEGEGDSQPNEDRRLPSSE